MKRICLESLRKAYGEQHVLNGLSAVLVPDEPTAITGPSGAGKTTLLRLIANLEQPDSGTVQLEGIAGFGFCFQEDRLAEGFDAVENIRLFTGLRNRDQIRKELLCLLPADSLDKPVHLLSGGQRRRIAVIRACLCESDVLLLDEPFAGLDQRSAELTASYILEKSHGKVLLLAAHEADIPPYCKKQLIIG